MFAAHAACPDSRPLESISKPHLARAVGDIEAMEMAGADILRRLETFKSAHVGKIMKYGRDRSNDFLTKLRLVAQAMCRLWRRQIFAPYTDANSSSQQLVQLPLP